MTYLKPLIESGRWQSLIESDDGLLYKLKLLGICGRYYNLMQSFLDNRHQRVILSGKSLKWSLVEAGVPQGSILGPLLFLVYINDFPQGLRCNAKLFADDIHFSQQSLALQYHHQILMKTYLK